MSNQRIQIASYHIKRMLFWGTRTLNYSCECQEIGQMPPACECNIYGDTDLVDLVWSCMAPCVQRKILYVNLTIGENAKMNAKKNAN